MTLEDARARLIRLQAERLDASDAGVSQGSPYMTRLCDAIEGARDDYTQMAVIEIAALRHDLATLAAG